MTFQEFFLATSMITALVALRFGVPLLCTWLAGCVMHRFAHHSEHI